MRAALINKYSRGNKQLKLVKVLVEEYGADINIKDKYGQNALSWCRSWDSFSGRDLIEDYLKGRTK